jgi:hypothetical protein
MRKYDPDLPLIAIHVPKAAGTSIREIYHEWFGENLYLHYFNEKRGELPARVELVDKVTGKPRPGICIYGHFNKNRGFGIHSYYPEVEQFVTILRDPFELAVSEYFYLKKAQHVMLDKSHVPATALAEYLDSITPNMLNHFPFEMTLENYEEIIDKYFIHIGITEDLETSMRVIATKLGFEVPASIRQLNITERTEEVPYDIKQNYIRKHPVEYAVYEFARENFTK